MPVKLLKSELSQWLSAAVKPGDDCLCEGVEFDSRRLRGGELFVALPGEQQHGHEFVEAAFAAGAALAVVSDQKFLDGPWSSRVLVVNDTLHALQELAKRWREALRAPVLGITGSMGKTTAKDMLAHVLATLGPTTRSTKSFNNHIGVPYTLCQASAGDAFIALEMGMNHPGELRELSAIAQPDLVAITCIAPVHMEFFASLEAIADAKWEITSGLRAGGAIVLNGDDQQLRALAARHPEIQSQISWFGSQENSDCRVELVRSFEDRIHCRFHYASEAAEVVLPLIGTHNAFNAAAAMLSIKKLLPGVALEKLVTPLATMEAPPMRLNRLKLPGQRLLIDDSYNANPEAMKAALELTAPAIAQGQKVGLLLGDMKELGHASERYHREIGRAIGRLKPAFAICVGNQAEFYAEEAREAGVTCEICYNPEAAADAALAQEFDVLLVKASRGIGLDRSVRHIVRKLQPS